MGGANSIPSAVEPVSAEEAQRIRNKSEDIFEQVTLNSK